MAGHLRRKLARSARHQGHGSCGATARRGLRGPTSAARFRALRLTPPARSWRSTTRVGRDRGDCADPGHCAVCGSRGLGDGRSICAVPVLCQARFAMAPCPADCARGRGGCGAGARRGGDHRDGLQDGRVRPRCGDCRSRARVVLSIGPGPSHWRTGNSHGEIRRDAWLPVPGWPAPRRRGPGGRAGPGREARRHATPATAAYVDLWDELVRDEHDRRVGRRISRIERLEAIQANTRVSLTRPTHFRPHCRSRSRCWWLPSPRAQSSRGDR